MKQKTATDNVRLLRHIYIHRILRNQVIPRQHTNQGVSECIVQLKWEAREYVRDRTINRTK